MMKHFSRTYVAIFTFLLLFLLCGQAALTKAALTWNIQIVDSTGKVGWDASIAVDSSGNSHISYSDNENGGLKYAKLTSSTWNTQTVDATRFSGYFNSIALDSSGNPHISYYDGTRGYLKYAKWTGSAWDIQTVDSTGNVGFPSSIALDSSGNPHISYRDQTNGDLKYAVGSSPTIPEFPTSIITLAFFGTVTSAVLFLKRRYRSAK